MRITFITLLLLCLNLGCGKQKVAHAPVGQSHAEDVLTYEDSEEAHAAAKVKAATETKGPSTIVEIANPIVEKAIRKELKKPEGELTKADLEKVTALALGGNQLTKFPEGLENLTKLTALNIYENKLTSVKGLENLTQLKLLVLVENQLTEIPKGLENLTQLKLLVLDENQLTEIPKGQEKLTQLEALSLGGNQLTDVTGLEKFNQLESLGLDKNKLTSVKGLEKLTQLTELNLLSNKLTDVEGLEKLTKLKTLSLSGNPDLPKAQIAELKKVLPRCKIHPLTKEESAKVIEAEIREELKKPTGELTKADLEKVEELWLLGDKLTDVEGLEKLTQLKELYLIGNPDLTKAQIDQLQKALPNCRIISNPTK